MRIAPEMRMDEYSSHFRTFQNFLWVGFVVLISEACGEHITWYPQLIMSAFFGAFRLLGRHSPKVFKTVIFATCGTAVAAFSFPFASQSLEAESHLYTANWYKLPTSGPVYVTFSSTKNILTLIASPPPRAGHSITAVGDKIVLLGGADKDGLLLLCDAHVLVCLFAYSFTITTLSLTNINA